MERIGSGSVECDGRKGATGEISRRGFIAGAGVAAVGAMAVGAQAASAAPSSKSEDAAGSAAAATGSGSVAKDAGTATIDAVVEQYTPKWSWETKPDPIPDDQISKVVQSDVVIVGAGISGMTAAMKAAEMGASVQVLEKLPSYPPTHPTGFAAVNSRLLEERGAHVDRDKLIQSIMGTTNVFRGKQDVLSVWVDRSGEFADWVEKILADDGIALQVGGFEGYYLHLDKVADAPLSMPDEGEYYDFWPLQHQYGSSPDAGVGLAVDEHEDDYMGTFQRYAESNGAVFNFSTRAQQLVQDESGRVTGVVATDDSGAYVRYDAAKGVYLATGGFDYDDEMLAAYFPIGLRMAKTFQTWFTGDGHKMAMWAGAQMEHTCTAHTLGSLAVEGDYESRFSAMNQTQPWAEWEHGGNAMSPCLWVNANGDRFMNEEIGYFDSAFQIDQQSGRIFWALWDDAWQDKIVGHYAGRFMDDGDSRERNDICVENGWTLKADTLEDLAEQMGVPADELLKTVERYNQICADGEDPDFLKPARYLNTSLDTPPYYAQKRGNAFMTTTGGVAIDAQMHILDADKLPIPGLYAGANPAGSCFGDTYWHTIPMSLSGTSMTLSMVAAENIVNGI
ncbi:MAG: FAD-dependent oxidoreductase [Coriobacteriales bacterium]|jgi:fumarate reductase flavoprotein subunit